MVDGRTTILAVLTAVILVGTTYSTIYSTYLDTSNPLLAHLPHPLHRTHYFASKSNILNVYFIKWAWAWTSAAYLILWATSAPTVRTFTRWVQWAAGTIAWMAFTSWFFGPAIVNRVLVASGGECVVMLPQGGVLDVPSEFCETRTAISPGTHPTLFALSMVGGAAKAGLDQLAPDWRGRPRLMRGHDVSGHIFLLVLSVLFLADQLRLSFRAGNMRSWSVPHRVAVMLNVLLIGVWFLACWTTSVYFHSPLEKLSGYLIGVASFAFTQLFLWEPRLGPAQVKLHSS